MNALDLKIALCEIDGGRFEDVVHALKIIDVCSECDHFNKSINDPGKEYRCKTSPVCIAATLHPHVVSYLNMKLGWIGEAQHLANLGLNELA